LVSHWAQDKGQMALLVLVRYLPQGMAGVTGKIIKMITSR